MHTNTDTVAEIIIALERQALDHWNRGDVEGQLRFYAEDVTYFDPITPTRIDGWPAAPEQGRHRPCDRIVHHAALTGNSPRSLRDRFTSRSRWHGRSLPGARRHPRSLRGGEGPVRFVRA